MSSNNIQSYGFKPLNLGRIVIWSLFALALIVAPLLFKSSLALTMLSQIGYLIIICLSYNMLLGQGGMLSFGHAVYTGLGSFHAIHAMNMAGKSMTIPVSLIPIVGGLAGMGFAALLGFVTTKKSGTTFAMITMGVGELVASMALMLPDFFGGEGGITTNRVYGQSFMGISFGPQIQVYYLIAFYCFVCTAAMFAFTGTPLGRILNAVRDNPERVEFIGYNTQRVRYFAFIIAGFFAGVGGGLATINFEIVTGADSLSVIRSGGYLLFTFLGGATLLLRAHHRCGAAGVRFGAAVRAEQGLAAVPGAGVPVHGDVCARRHRQPGDAERAPGPFRPPQTPAELLSGHGPDRLGGGAGGGFDDRDALPPAAQRRPGPRDGVPAPACECRSHRQLAVCRGRAGRGPGSVRAGAAPLCGPLAPHPGRNRKRNQAHGGPLSHDRHF